MRAVARVVWTAGVLFLLLHPPPGRAAGTTAPVPAVADLGPAPESRLRIRRPRAWDRQHPGHDLRGGLGVEAVHRRRDPAPGPGGQAQARRSRRPVRPRAARLRHAHHPAPSPPSHQRPSRLGHRHLCRGLAARLARAHARARARRRLAPEGAQLPARERIQLQQHRLQPPRHHRGAREREDVRPVHARRDLRAAGDDADAVARRLHADRQGARHRLRQGAGRLPHADAVRERARQRRAADHGGRPPEVEPQLHQRARGRPRPHHTGACPRSATPARPRAIARS